MNDIKLVGLKELEEKLKDNVTLNDVKRVVKMNGSELHSGMQRAAIFKGGYSTGRTKQSITLGFEKDGLSAKVKPGTEYSPYVEYGTRYMAAQPFVRPSFNRQKKQFMKDLKKIMK